MAKICGREGERWQLDAHPPLAFLGSENGLELALLLLGMCVGFGFDVRDLALEGAPDQPTNPYGEGQRIR